MIEAGKKALDTHGAGLSSVRFICGTHVSYTEFNKVIFATFSKNKSFDIERDY